MSREEVGAFLSNWQLSCDSLQKQVDQVRGATGPACIFCAHRALHATAKGCDSDVTINE